MHLKKSIARSATPFLSRKARLSVHGVGRLRILLGHESLRISDSLEATVALSHWFSPDHVKEHKAWAVNKDRKPKPFAYSTTLPRLR